MFFEEINVVPTSGGQKSCRRIHFTGLDASSLWCSTALFLEGTVLLRIKICFLSSKDELSSVIKSDF